jgi:glycosyltransferase involved in cell wall biosynthesis
MLALFSRKSASSPLLREADRSHLSVIRLPDRFPGDPRSIGVLTAIADNADLIQTHGYKANVLMRLVARRINKPWLAFLHGDTWENWKVRAYFALERRAVRRADRVATVSQAMATRIARSGVPSERVCVIPNASVIELPPLAPQAWHRGTLPLVGVIGRLSPEKGVDLAIRAHVLLLRRRPDARLLIAGEGPEGATLRRLAERLGVATSLDWLGHREDLAALYPQLNVLLIPSRSEGMPNVALEAMSHGLPIVATTGGGGLRSSITAAPGCLSRQATSPPCLGRSATFSMLLSNVARLVKRRNVRFASASRSALAGPPWHVSIAS